MSANALKENLAEVLFRAPPDDWVEAILQLLLEVREHQTRLPPQDRLKAKKLRKILRDDALPAIKAKKRGNRMFK